MDRRAFLQGLASVGGVSIAVATAGCGGSDGSSTDPTNAGTKGGDGSDSSADGSSGGGDALTDTPLATAVVAKAFDFKTADDGHLVVTIPVENRASESRTRTVVVSVTADGDTYEQSTEVTLDSGESRTLDVGFPDVNMRETGSISAQISIEE